MKREAGVPPPGMYSGRKDSRSIFLGKQRKISTDDGGNDTGKFPPIYEGSRGRYQERSSLAGRFFQKNLPTFQLASKSGRQTPLHNVYVLHKVLPVELCNLIVTESHQHTFTTARHKHFPTVDIPLRRLRSSYPLFKEFMTEKIYPKIKSRYDLVDPVFSVVDLFVVKYSMSGQRKLGNHRDGSIISFNILLNSPLDFSGGGTCFADQIKVSHSDRGSCIIHCGKIKHSGYPITKGTRILLVGFLSVKSPSILPSSERGELKMISDDDVYLQRLWKGSTSPVPPPTGNTLSHLHLGKVSRGESVGTRTQTSSINGGVPSTCLKRGKVLKHKKKGKESRKSSPRLSARGESKKQRPSRSFVARNCRCCGFSA